MRLVIQAVEGKSLDTPLEYPFQQARVVLGRGAGSDVRIPHRSVSGQHAVVREDGTGHVVEDCDSTNGTHVNDARLVPKRARKLADGDRLRVGSYELRFYATPAVSEPMTVERTAELARRLLRADAKLAGPRLVVLDGPSSGATHALPEPPGALSVGRDPACAVVLDAPELAAEQLRVERGAEGVFAINLNGAHSVQLHGQSFERRRLHDGDELSLGSVRVLFEDPAEESLQAATDEPDLAWSAPPPTPSAASAAPPAAAPDAAAGPARSTPPRTPSSPAPAAGSQGPQADVLIYGLAALILALSGVGLYLLMSAD